MSKKKKGAIAGVAAAVVIVCAAGAGNATYTINEQEQAVVTTFGVSHAVTDPGLHFKIPFVQHVTKVNTTIQSLRIGYDNNNDVKMLVHKNKGDLIVQNGQRDGGDCFELWIVI